MWNPLTTENKETVMIKKYHGLTKKQAEDMLAESTKEMTVKFCPIARNGCSTNCACFSFGRIYNNMPETSQRYGDMWNVSPSTCLNPMITGIITVERA